MRTTLLVCATLATFAVGTRLLAQDCGMSCQECDCGCNCEICFPKCSENDCYDQDCPDWGCPDQGACDQGRCNRVACSAETCNTDDCNQASCNEAPCNQGDCDPYTYYQLREDWRRTHGPILDSVRWLHSTCPKKHHHHNGNAAAQQRASQTPWHGAYYYPQWGGPVALVVPPTAEFQTNYGWGVPASRISPIDAQFSRSYPGYGAGVVGGNGFLPPPLQPSDTNQFGVYYVRGPW